MRRSQSSAAEKMITKSAILKRGWTEALIAELLGEADEKRVNPHHKSGPPMQLWREARVEASEKSAAFKKFQRDAVPRRDAAKKSLETKAKKLQAYIDGLVVEVPWMDEASLIQKAVKHFNDSPRSERGDFNLADVNSDPAFLQRICVNFLRHAMTDYEERLNEVHGRVGGRDAYVEIKLKVLEAIGEKYPSLSQECDRQMHRVIDR